ncbi:hypothetical protein INT82_13155 [Mannheimia haemolytica]|nr:hypothetical protein [Mannheimia haemolytica]
MIAFTSKFFVTTGKKLVQTFGLALQKRKNLTACHLSVRENKNHSYIKTITQTIAY